jgi:hypothetical protein
MRFAFVAKHRSIWPVAWLCEALDVSRSGFHAWLNRSPSRRTRENETLLDTIRRSFLGSDRTPAFAGAGSMAHGVSGGMCWLRALTVVFTGLSA